MRKRQHNNANKVMAGLLVICLSACIVLMVGVSYARYQQEFAPVDYFFTAKEDNALVLGGVVTQSWLDAGSWPENPNWLAEEKTAELHFSVSNGRAASDFAKQDHTYTLQLLVGLSAGSAEAVVTDLSYEKYGQVVKLHGVAEEIPDGSMLQSQFGDGWIYRFYDESGKEQTFTAAGGALHYQNFVLTFGGMTDPALLQVRVSEPYKN